MSEELGSITCPDDHQSCLVDTTTTHGALIAKIPSPQAPQSSSSSSSQARVKNVRSSQNSTEAELLAVDGGNLSDQPVRLRLSLEQKGTKSLYELSLPSLR